jgi:hypothetical protein
VAGGPQVLKIVSIVPFGVSNKKVQGSSSTILMLDLDIERKVYFIGVWLRKVGPCASS